MNEKQYTDIVIVPMSLVSPMVVSSMAVPPVTVPQVVVSVVVVSVVVRTVSMVVVVVGGVGCQRSAHACYQNHLL